MDGSKYGFARLPESRRVVDGTLSDVGEHHGREYRGVRAEHLDECARLLVSTFNAEPWNQRWTLETAQKKLAWTLGVPGFIGLISLAEGVVAFAAGYR
jgi:hypothetical protein